MAGVKVDRTSSSRMCSGGLILFRSFERRTLPCSASLAAARRRRRARRETEQHAGTQVGDVIAETEEQREPAHGKDRLHTDKL